MIITVQHLRLVKYCASGSKGFFNRYGLDFKDFIKNGIDSKVLLATGDPMAKAIVEAAQKEK